MVSMCGTAGPGNSSGPADAAVTELSSSKLLRNIKGIIFDFDGTLFDNVLIPFYLIAAYPPDLLRLRMERHVRKQFTGCDYSSPGEYYRVFFAALGKVCFRSPERMRNWYKNRFMPRMIKVLKKHYKPRPGVAELLGRFDSKAGEKANSSALRVLPANFSQEIPRVAIYSDYPCLRERLEALGITAGPHILLYGPESFGAQKPAARPFLRIAADLGAAPEEVLVVGDREDTDGLGAFKTGMRYFCLETGHRRYFRLDPYRHPRLKNGEPQGPSLLMYAGTWDDLNKLLTEKFFNLAHLNKSVNGGNHERKEN